MFTAKKSAIAEALKLVGSIVERRNTIPILSNVLIEATSKTQLSARVSDLDTEATIPFNAEVLPGFKPFTVPAQLLNDIIRKLPDGVDVLATAENEHLTALTLKAGRSKFSLPVLPASDFPTMATGDLPFVLELPAQALARAIDNVGFAISTEETRYYLNGIFFHRTDGGVTLVATDGHRLSKQFIRAEDVPADMPGIIVPKKTVETIASNLPKDGTVTLQVSDAKIRLIMGETVLLSKLIDGTFPDYQRLIPTNEQAVEIEAKPFAAALARVTTFSTGSRAVKLTFADGTLKLSVKNPDVGSAEDEIAYDGQMSIETGFNGRYMDDALKHLGDGSIRLMLGEVGSPAILRADGDHADNLIVLMPMRV